MVLFRQLVFVFVLEAFDVWEMVEGLQIEDALNELCLCCVVKVVV